MVSNLVTILDILMIEIVWKWFNLYFDKECEFEMIIDFDKWIFEVYISMKGYWVYL